MRAEVVSSRCSRRSVLRSAAALAAAIVAGSWARPRTLRTTQAFRRDGDRWVRLHRHADPLLGRRSLEATLALLE